MTHSRQANTFESVFEKFLTPLGSDDCWPWAGYCNKQGYGSVSIRCQEYLAHRLKWLVEFGDPGSFLVLHRCDNPPCCNPAHLFLGAPGDNMKDMDKKGRRAIGWKLTKDCVRIIKERLAQGDTQLAIAKDFGVSQSHISNIHHGKTWTNI